MSPTSRITRLKGKPLIPRATAPPGRPAAGDGGKAAAGGPRRLLPRPLLPKPLLSTPLLSRAPLPGPLPAIPLPAPGRRLPAAVFLGTLTVLLGWWAAFFPGLLSYDSVAYTWQVTTGHWMDNHSVLYDCLLWASIRISGGLWLLTLGQVVAASAVLAYTCVALRDLGARGRWSAAAALALVLLPATGTLPVFVWKDSAFTLSAVLSFAAALRLLARRLDGRAGLRDAGFWRRLGLLQAGFLGLALFRNNSVLVVLAAAPLLVAGLPLMRRWVAGAAATATAVFLVLQFAVYPAVGIRMPRTDQLYAFNYADIAVAYGEYPQTFTAADRRVMAQVAPLSHWGGPGADCWDVDDTMAAPFDRAAAAAHNDQLMRIWWRVLKRTPQAVAQAHLCRSQIGWGVFPGPAGEDGQTMISAPVVPHDLFGWADWSSMGHSRYRAALTPRPVARTIRRLAVWYYELSTARQTQWLLWRGALWCYAAYAVGWSLVRRRGLRTGAAVIALTAGLQLSVLAANPAPLARYMLPPIYLGVLTLPLLRTGRAARG